MSTTYRPAPDVGAAQLDDELTLLEPVSGTYFGLDAVGARVWELLQPGATLDELLDALTAEFDVPRATCAADVGELLDVLVARGLVRER